MTVPNGTADPTTLTLTFVAEFDAAPEAVWQVWEDPRKLERWWGPPTYPATFTRHEFVAGGESRYHMTGPDGDQPSGWWRIEAIDRPRSLEFSDGFAGSDGEPLPGDEPVTMRVTFEPTDRGTRMTTVTHFVSTEQMEKMIKMGMQEGMGLAMGQIDAVLASAG
ncbi:activator of HSP90 ATPase [Actinocatenispora thailandica]|uniref:Activator of HSP90 ATPase n=1 Tax=Actinocatenispora thailandica TaxID=227318 RepID=A0A7R7DML7_9ACTN|nr:SRPBCC domain-containing protein [Actinocatenispora thailandica]BCJ34408.1 activator of HSP90 ATPase [Actinocatenispora thailandica]